MRGVLAGTLSEALLLLWADSLYYLVFCFWEDNRDLGPAVVTACQRLAGHTPSAWATARATPLSRAHCSGTSLKERKGPVLKMCWGSGLFFHTVTSELYLSNRIYQNVDVICEEICFCLTCLRIALCGMHLAVLYSRGTCSRTPSGCLQVQSVPNPICTLFFPIQTYQW